MSDNKYTKSIRAADQLTIKALQAEFDEYKRQAECAARLFGHVIDVQKEKIEQLERYIYANGAKL